MSFDGQVLCQRIEIGPVCPLAIIGKPRVAPARATPLAAFRNLRRSTAMPLSADVVLRGRDLRIICPPETAAKHQCRGVDEASSRSVLLPRAASRPSRSAGDYTSALSASSQV